jgi:hypothetical protein
MKTPEIVGLQKSYALGLGYGLINYIDPKQNVVI